jgi:hypothetical protein
MVISNLLSIFKYKNQTLDSMKQLNYTLSLLMAVFMLSFSSVQAQYCDGPINGNDDEWITNVSFANVDHDTDQFVSTANTINATATVDPGEVISVTVGVTTNGTWTENVVVYFDLDNDFTFETSIDLGTMATVANTEVTFDGGGANTVTMPTTPGTYRMRVVMDFLGPVPGPCDSDNASAFKDSEDYEIVVTGSGGPTCSDGIQNGDETGVDCGGSSCQPCGVTPTCSDGIQNGDEEGVDCGGSSCPPCEAECLDYQLTLLFDDFANETSWQLEDEDGVVLYSGDDYDSDDDFTTLVEDFCLEEGCYEFTIFDSFGDGICCDYGDGFYQITDEEGNVVVSGSDFGGEESTVFCTDCTPPSASVNVVNYCQFGVFLVQVNLSDLGGASTVVIEDSEGNSLNNVFFAPRTYIMGPYNLGTDVNIAIYDSENPNCGTEFTGLTSGCAVIVGDDTPTAFGTFPNPTTGDVNVNVAQYIGKDAEVSIYNAMGQLIEQRQLRDIQTMTEQFDLSNQQSGMYMININVDGEVHTERIQLSK